MASDSPSSIRRANRAGRSALWLSLLGAVLIGVAASSWGGASSAQDPVQTRDAARVAIIAGPSIISSPQSGDTYAKGETIEVALTYAAPVTVTVNEETGGPRVRLEIGERTRWARYDRSGQGGARLIFSYTVRGKDADGDGVSIPRNALELAGGTIVDAADNPARLKLAALPDQSGHNVDGAPDPPPPTPPAANREPQFAAESTERSVAENASVGANVGDPLTAADGDGDPLTYALSGATAFEIDATTGQIRVAGLLDYETRASYAVTVTVHDGQNAAGDTDTNADDSIAVTISITDVAEDDTVTLDPDALRVAGELTAVLTELGAAVSAATTALAAANTEPQFGSESTDRSVAENAAAGASVGAPLTAADRDGDTLTYALSGADAFEIDAATGRISVAGALDHETQASYAVTVTVHDGKDAAGEPDTSVDDSIAVTISIGNVDEEGTVTLDAETPQVGSALTASLSDPDGGVSGVTWVWERWADRSAWDAISGATERAYTPVADDAGRYLQVTASYSDGEASGKTAQVMAAGMVAAATANREPQFASKYAERRVAENIAIGGNVGAPVTASDSDDDTLTYALEGDDKQPYYKSDHRSFSIDQETGQIRANRSLRYVDTKRDFGITRTIFALKVTVSDGNAADGSDDASVDDSITIYVYVTADVDQAGTVTLSPDSKLRVGRQLTARLDDPDGGVSGVTWVWERSADRSAWVAISGATEDAYTPVVADARQHLRVTASYSDRRGPGKTAQAIASVNRQPQFASATATRSVEDNIAIGANIGGPVTATDGDDDSLTYALTGTDAGAFGINATTGQITVKDALDYETQASYSVTVTVHDGMSDFGDADTSVDDSIAVTISVTKWGDPFAAKWNDLPAQPWFRPNQSYSCATETNTKSPWTKAGLVDLGGSDPLSLIRYYGNGSYIRYGAMGDWGCTPQTDLPRFTHRDPPVDPTYYSLGDLDIFVDIVQMPNGGGLQVDSTMKQAVDLLNAEVATYYKRVSGNKFRITFKAGNQLSVKGKSHSKALDAAIGKAAPCAVGAGDTPDCSQYGGPGGLSRIVFVNGTQWGWAQGSHGFVNMHLREIRFSYLSVEGIIHEIGHAFMSWPHSPIQVSGVPLDPYSNQLSVMSGLLLFDSRRGRMDWKAELPPPLAIYRYSAGWIAPSEVALHLTNSATYTLSKPLDDAHAGKQFLVVHSGRAGAFTTLEALPDRPAIYRNRVKVYDSSNPNKRRRFRYDGVLVSRYDQTGGTGAGARFGPALYDPRNPDFVGDINASKDDYSVIGHGETRHIGGGVMVAVSKNEDGSYQVKVSGGKIAAYQPWCWGSPGRGNGFDSVCKWDWSKSVRPSHDSDVLKPVRRN